MTREHVFAHWLVAKTHASRLVSARAPDAPRISRVIATVCADCNAGWMSGLEVSFRRLAFARARVGPIAPVDRTTLARWFTKTAALLADANGLPLVPRDALPALRTGMPDEVEVYLARRRRTPQRLDFALLPEADRVRSVSITVDDLVAHVAPSGTLAGRHGTRLWPLRTHTLRWDTLPVLPAAVMAAR
ncbi:MAG TPA: hypothetical protein VI814_07545 [Candidatus Limnocylindria bacterium]